MYLSHLLGCMFLCFTITPDSGDDGYSESYVSELEDEIEELKARLEEYEGEEDVEETANSTELMFDINSPSVYEQLIGTTGGNDDGIFEQDAITVGMSQTEVEEKYGPHEFSLYVGGADTAHYGNLSVAYSELAPAGDTPQGRNINPDENYVEGVYFFAKITEDELVQALGDPDYYDDGNGTMNGAPVYTYEGYGEDGRYYRTFVSTLETDNGILVGEILRAIYDEDPTQGLSDEDNFASGDQFSELDGAISSYMYRLAPYYNYPDYPDILEFVEEGSSAHIRLEENKASGNYEDHIVHEATLISAEYLDNGLVKLSTARVYEHKTTNGPHITWVDYYMNPETLQIVDYEEIHYEPY